MASTLPAPNVLARLATPYRIGMINQKQQRCLRLLGKIWELKNDAGQTDYTANFNQLAQDAATALIGVDRTDLPAVMVGNNWLIASAISNAPNTLNSQLLAVGRLIDHDDDLLDRMETLVEYLLQAATGD